MSQVDDWSKIENVSKAKAVPKADEVSELEPGPEGEATAREAISGEAASDDAEVSVRATGADVSNDLWPEPRLLIEWPSPWQEFKTAIRPAMKRAPKALAGEAPVGIFPYRGLLLTWVFECLVLLVLIFLPDQIAKLNPGPLPAKPSWDVIYYSGDELPRTADKSGAEAGKSGRAGGQQAHHRSQVIHVARGNRLSETVADAPKLNLPHSDSAVANLLAFKSNPGPPPAEGLGSKLTTPLLSALTPVPPSPQVQARSSRTQGELANNIVPPTPEVSHANTRSTPALSPTLVAPTPDVKRDKMRNSNSLSTNVVAPAPQETPRDLASSRAPLSQTVNVVAPPVSAPARETSSPSRLSLPPQAVVAPPPSQVSRDLNSWGSTRSGDMRAQPVAPPPSYAGSGTPARSAGGTLSAQVVPPPASVAGMDGHGSSGGTGSRTSGGRATELGSSTAVPPPPGLGGGQAISGPGRGNKGTGAGGPLDLGSSVAPPKSSGGNSAGNGVVVSGEPGTKVGLPNKSGGAISLSPTGTARAGIGGSGAGSGIGHGAGGPGSGLAAEGSGAGREGAGHGSDPSAHGGISPYPGPGGSGNGSGPPAMPGVSVQGGTTMITLPSFADPKGDAPTSGPGRSSTNNHTGSGITIEATPRSGGVFAYYGVLRGDRNYSIYIDTSIGTAVMQYADPASASHPSGDALAAPEVMRKELPSDLRPARVVIACILSREGDLKNLKVLESGQGSEATRSKILVALRSWKFRPAFRGNDPVEVDAILGFGVDTR